MKDGGSLARVKTSQERSVSGSDSNFAWTMCMSSWPMTYLVGSPILRNGGKHTFSLVNWPLVSVAASPLYEVVIPTLIFPLTSGKNPATELNLFEKRSSIFGVARWMNGFVKTRLGGPLSTATPSE